MFGRRQSDNQVFLQIFSVRESSGGMMKPNLFIIFVGVLFINGILFFCTGIPTSAWGARLLQPGEAIQIQSSMKVCTKEEFFDLIGSYDKIISTKKQIFLGEQNCSIKLSQKSVIVIITLVHNFGHILPGDTKASYPKIIYYLGRIINHSSLKTVYFFPQYIPHFAIISTAQCEQLNRCIEFRNQAIEIKYWGSQEKDVCYEATQVALNAWYDATSPPGQGGRSEQQSIENAIEKNPGLGGKTHLHERHYLMIVIHFIYNHASEMPEYTAEKIAKSRCQKDYHKYPFEKGHFFIHR
jgi:hypothetical protein